MKILEALEAAGDQALDEDELYAVVKDFRSDLAKVAIAFMDGVRREKALGPVREVIEKLVLQKKVQRAEYQGRAYYYLVRPT